MKKIILCFFVLLLVICACVYAVQPVLNNRHKPKKVHNKVLNSNKHVKFFWNLRLRDGVPIIRIRLGEDYTTVIYDTGSTQLNIAHKSCSNCYKGDGMYSKPLLKDAEISTIEYGSQKDRVAKSTDLLHLSSPDDLNSQEDAVEVPFYTTLSREEGDSGNSNLNVFGAMRRQEDDSLSNYILGSQDSVVLDLYRHSKGYVAGVSQKHIESMFERTPFTAIPYSKIGSLPFYVLRVDSIRVFINQTQAFETQDVDLAIVDSGSNMFTLPASVADSTLGLVEDEHAHNVRIQIDFTGSNTGSNTGGKSLTLYKENIFWKTSHEAMIDGDMSALSFEHKHNTCVLGTHALMGRTIVFSPSTFYFTDSKYK